MKDKNSLVVSALQFLFVFVVSSIVFILLCILFSSHLTEELNRIMGLLMIGSILCMTFCFTGFNISLMKIKYSIYTTDQYEEKKIFIFYRVKFSGISGVSWYILPTIGVKRTTFIDESEKKSKGSVFLNTFCFLIIFMLITCPIWEMSFYLLR